MGNVSIRVPTRQIREFSTFSVRSARSHSPSARCVIAANYTFRVLEIFSRNYVSLEETFLMGERVKINYLF
jgi:hypothetical protein